MFLWHNPSGRTVALGSTQPLTEMSTRNISWGLRRPVRRADNLTTFMCWLSWNLGASTFWNLQGLSRAVMGDLYLYLMEWQRGLCGVGRGYLKALYVEFKWLWWQNGYRIRRPVDVQTEFRSYTHMHLNTLRTGSFKLFKRPFPGFLTILTL